MTGASALEVVHPRGHGLRIPAGFDGDCLEKVRPLLDRAMDASRMFSLSKHVRVFLAREPVDMRKSCHALAAPAERVLEQDPLSGHLFVFVNRRPDRMKLLDGGGTGFWIWYQQLERGTYAYLRDVSTRWPTLRDSELETLLPDRWIEEHPQHRIEERLDEAWERARRTRGTPPQGRLKGLLREEDPGDWQHRVVLVRSATSEEALISTSFLGKVTFGGGLESDRPGRRNRGESLRILSDGWQAHQHDLDMFQQRYESVKQIGQRSLAALEQQSPPETFSRLPGLDRPPPTNDAGSLLAGHPPTRRPQRPRPLRQRQEVQTLLRERTSQLAAISQVAVSRLVNQRRRGCIAHVYPAI